jgi:hypothetical protein
VNASASGIGQLDGDGEKELEPVSGWVELAPMYDMLEEARYRDDNIGENQSDARISEESLMTQYTYRLPPSAWNTLLFRYYKERDEFFDPVKCKQGDPSRAPTPESRESKESDKIVKSPRGVAKIPKSNLDPRATIQVDDSGAIGDDDGRSEKASSIGTSNTRGSRKQGMSAIGKTTFRMRWGMAVEWRVRISDGFLWSPWSPVSQPTGLVPPIPAFTTHMHLDFSRWEPTIARMSWGVVSLPPGYEHLAPTVEYVVFMESDADTAREVLQAGRGTFSPEMLQRKGISLSEGTCGLVNPISTNAAPDDEATSPSASGRPAEPFDLNTLFNDSSERRIVGKFTAADAKWINFVQEGNDRPVTGFELAVSGLRPESVHRFSVRARCVSLGLDLPDWQKMKLDNQHPLRWSDPLHTAPVLTPRTPPPLLVPQPVRIPDGRFGRFMHTPCVLLKCSLFKKAHEDDFDKAHPFVLDIRAAGEADEDYKEVPLENSVYCEIEPYGPCRLLFNVPHLKVEVRTRNTVMNDISAACPAVLTVPPMALGGDGPHANMIVTDDGHLFVELTWTVRCLPEQELEQMQIAFKRHSVEAETTELQAISITQPMKVEEMPSNFLMAAKDEYCAIAQEVLEEAEAAVASGTPGLQTKPRKGQQGCPSDADAATRSLTCRSHRLLQCLADGQRED